VVLAVLALSGGHRDDPRTPPGLPGLPAPFLGTAVVGSGGRTVAVDAYGDVVDLRVPGPAGRAQIAVSAKRQAAGTVPAGDAIVAQIRLRDGRALPLWRADSIRQRYLPGTNVLRTVARLDSQSAVVVRPAGGHDAVRADRRWLARAQPLGAGAPHWARAMYRRSLLVLRALTDRRTGAVVAGPRDGWAYVWPRDAAAVAIAFASAGFEPEARRIARFLMGLDLNAAARFDGTGAPVPGRAAQGDAEGWVAAATRAVGLERSVTTRGRRQWRGRADYQEGDTGDYLGNAIASGLGGHRVAGLFGSHAGLTRIAGDMDSGLDSTAAWAVRPFSRPALFPAIRRTLMRLVTASGRFGIVPSQNWHGGEDPWTAPTAWSAWSLAALAREGAPPWAHLPDLAGFPRGRWLRTVDRKVALRLMADLRRAATPLGLLPERVDARTGLPTSTTPLAWSHAFAILALHELWPGRAGS
jgi:Glycosyl hydrolases family 15